MNFEKIERISKKMEKWHNRIYRYVCIGIFVLIADIIGLGIMGWSSFRATHVIGTESTMPFMMYDFIVYIGSPLIFAFLVYTMMFTQFSFPVKFKGDGGGRKNTLPFTK